MVEWSGFLPCTCIAVDAQSYGCRNDRTQSEMQHDLLKILDSAARSAGLDRSQWQTQPKGDEQLTVLPMNGDEPRLVDDYFRHLTFELQHYNGQRTETARMRLRAAVHHGLVELADNGFAGTAVVVTARLLNSRPLYGALAEHPTADLALMLSDDVFRATVLGGHTTLRSTDFSRVAVKEKEYESIAWLTVPAIDMMTSVDDGEGTPVGRSWRVPTDLSKSATEADGDLRTANTGDSATMRNSYRADKISVTNMTGPVDARKAVFGFGNTDV